jgi:hypothetical protein
MRRFIHVLIVSGILIGLFSSSTALGQNSAPPSEVEALQQEILKLQERLNRLEQTQRPAVTPVAAQAQAPVAPRPGEREILLEKENILETIGLPKPEVAGAKFTGFFVGSYSYNSGLQIVPEAFGGTPALADPGRTNFRFDKFGFGVSKVFADWLSASAAIEVENHRDRHTHIITDGTRGCPSGQACERFGAEAAETKINLDRFNLTVVAPVGNGLSLSLGRFDLPFGIERHDENLLLTATTSEVFRFGRPQKMTGFQAAYSFAPWLDATAWFVNRWESEDTGESDFNDINQGKSVGGRVGVSPFPREGLLNFGLGGWYGSEGKSTADRLRTDRHRKRWVLDGDFTWSPTPRLFFAGEAVYGGEDKIRTLGRVGRPVSEDAESDKDVNWWGFYLLGHYDFVKWLGLTFRYGVFDDFDRGRTGVHQTLHSFTLTPVLHLSALIPDLRPMGVTVPRTRHPFHWVDLKLEYRLNVSDRDVFGEAQPGHSLHNRASDTSHQIQLQAVVNF